MTDAAAVPPAIRVTPASPASHTAQSWPIAAAMLQFGPFTRDGTATVDATAEQWAQELAPVRDEGFDHIELANRWLDLAAISSQRRTELAEVLRNLGLNPQGYLVASRSIAAPDARSENVAYTHASIDAAADLGIPTVCIGLHSVPPRTAGGPMWFWTAGGDTFGSDEADLPFLVSSLRDLGAHAAERSVALSVEMYPDTHVGTARRAVDLVRRVGLDNVGLNPDLGNLVRVQGPIEEWEDVVVQTLPYTNYWHMKNYARLESPPTGLVLTHPVPLESGLIDYRLAIRFALGVGFAGTFVAEHYGGDGLGVSASNAAYLRRLLRSEIPAVREPPT